MTAVNQSDLAGSNRNKLRLFCDEDKLEALGFGDELKDSCCS
jgi:hypothetical protein